MVRRGEEGGAPSGGREGRGLHAAVGSGEARRREGERGRRGGESKRKIEGILIQIFEEIHRKVSSGVFRRDVKL